jgi:hypothetical protein
MALLWHNYRVAKNPNSASSETITVTISEQSEQLLEELARRGVYGRNPAEVAGRFIDQALQQFIDRPALKPVIKRKPGRMRRVVKL